MLPPGAGLVFLRWGLGLGLLALAVFGIRQWGYAAGAADLDQEQRDHRATKGFYAQVLKDLADKTKAAADKARHAAAIARTEGAANDARYQEATRNADQAREDLRRALRDGTVGLRPWWACGVPGPAESGTAPVAGGQDDAADLREAGALDLVSGADHADRWITWLQSELTSTRKAVIDGACAVEVSP